MSDISKIKSGKPLVFQEPRITTGRKNQMLLFQSILLCLLAGYILGGISGGHIAGKLYKTDVREHGSGNLGATNVLRTLGVKAAVLTLAIDVLKVIIPVLVVRYVLFPQYEPFSYENQLLVLYIAFGAKTRKR